MNAHATRARTARLLSLAGALMALLVAIRTIDAHDLNGLLDGAGPRTGTTEGLVVFALAGAAGAAALLARRAPGWATFILAAAGAGGAFAAGGAWLLPAPLLLAGSLWALMAVPDPFAAAGVAEDAADTVPHAEDAARALPGHGRDDHGG